MDHNSGVVRDSKLFIASSVSACGGEFSRGQSPAGGWPILPSRRSVHEIRGISTRMEPQFSYLTPRTLAHDLCQTLERRAFGPPICQRNAFSHSFVSEKCGTSPVQRQPPRDIRRALARIIHENLIGRRKLLGPKWLTAILPKATCFSTDCHTP